MRQHGNYASCLAKRTRVDLHVAESTGLAIERLFSNRLYSSENNAISQPVMHGPFKRPQWRVRWRARLASFRLRPTDQSLESRTVSRFRPNNSYLSASRRVIQLSIRRVISLVPVPAILISFPLLVSLEIRYSIYINISSKKNSIFSCIESLFPFLSLLLST